MSKTSNTVLLVGFPNSGKSTIFNNLTGGNRKVSNYSGITTDSAIGKLELAVDDNSEIEIVDLPGIYGLNPTSLDEGVTVTRLLNLDRGKEYQLVAVVMDWQRFESSMSLALGLRKIIKDRLLLVINKDDQQEISDWMIQQLKERLKVDVLVTSAINDSGIELSKKIQENINRKKLTFGQSVKISKKSLQYLPKELDQCPIDIVESEKEVVATINQSHIEARGVIRGLSKPHVKKSDQTSKIDRFVLNPVFGGILFLAIFYFIFHAIYTWSGPAMDLIENLMGGLAEFIAAYLPDGYFKSLLIDGIIGGVGGVIVFVPQIAFLFFLLSLLEQSGYISRAAVVTDRLLGMFGLNGKAFLPYMSGFACSIPGIMATRTIPNEKERLATLMTIPMITCSARLPVYILLVGTFVPNRTIFGVFNTQALSFFFLYFLGSFFALIMAKVFRLTFFKGDTGSFIIDLPLYQKPSLRTALKQAYLKAAVFLRKAGTIILSLSILIWFLGAFPTPGAELTEGKTKQEIASIELQHSLLGTMGRTIEPIIKPLGMDWKMGVSLLVAFGARELFVSTMGTIYALGDVDEESDSLRQRLKNEINPETGKPTFNLAVAWSLLIFFVFSLQCTSTLAILRRETGSWKIPIFMFGYMGTLAYIGAYIAYHALSV